MELVDARLFPDDALVELKLAVIRELNHRGVAVECPPTSNVRISRYNNYKEHHLFRWIGLRWPHEPKPLVCLASDDPGIFATTMRNEFIHVHRTLRDEFGLQEQEAMEKLAALIRFFETGHFALETHASEIAGAIRDFLGRSSDVGVA